jgi:hypothetical protein
LTIFFRNTCRSIEINSISLHEIIIIIIKFLEFYTYAAAFRSRDVIPVELSFCCCSIPDFPLTVGEGDVSTLLLYFRRKSRSPIYIRKLFFIMTRLFLKITKLINSICFFSYWIFTHHTILITLTMLPFFYIAYTYIIRARIELCIMHC